MSFDVLFFLSAACLSTAILTEPIGPGFFRAVLYARSQNQKWQKDTKGTIGHYGSKPYEGQS